MQLPVFLFKKILFKRKSPFRCTNCQNVLLIEPNNLHVQAANSKRREKVLLESIFYMCEQFLSIYLIMRRQVDGTIPYTYILVVLQNNLSKKVHIVYQNFVRLQHRFRMHVSTLKMYVVSKFHLYIGISSGICTFNKGFEHDQFKLRKTTCLTISNAVRSYHYNEM